MKPILPPFQHQIEQISNLIKLYPLEVGEDQAFIISKEWFSQFQKQADLDNFQANPIGPIDNSNIINKDNELRLEKKENEDFLILPPPAWFQLLEWYGGGPSLPIPVRLNSSNQPVAIPFKFCIYCTYKSHDDVPFSVFNLMKLTELENEIRKKFHIKQNKEIRFFAAHQAKTLNKTETIAQNNIYPHCKLFIDYRKQDNAGSNKWYSEKSEKEQKETSSDDESDDENVYYNDDLNQIPGVCGLKNIGNTCYFNSALQCLFHCAPFIKHFFNTLPQNNWTQINSSNNSDSKKQLVITFVELAKDIWSGKYSSIRPVRLKKAIDEFTQQFQGTEQQDAHELLTFLLDGLHEELKTKTSVSTTPLKLGEFASMGLSFADIQASNESWIRHKSQSSSIIADMFQGLFRSQILCPICHQMTTVFDPYMILSLPLAKRNVDISIFIFVPLDYKKPYQKFELTYSSQEEAEQLLIKSLGFATTLVYAYREKIGVETSFIWGFPHKKPNVEIIALEVPSSVRQQDPRRKQQMVQFTQPPNPHSYYPNGTPYPFYQQVSPMYPQMPYTPNYNFMQPIPPPLNPLQNKPNNNGPYYVACFLNIKIRNKTLLDDAPTVITKNASAPFLIRVDNFNISQEELNAKVERYFAFCFNGTKANSTEETSHEIITSFLSDAVLNNEECNLDFTLYGTKIMVDFPSEYYIINHQKRFFKPSPMCNNLSHLFYPVYVNADLITSEDQTFNRDLMFKHVASIDDNNCHVNVSQITLNDCFNLFSEEEILDSCNQWNCKTCHHMVNAKKKIDVWSAPEILIIHLKRFITDNDTFKKIDSHVYYPDVLDMSPHLAGPEKNKKCLYKLFAVCNHYGSLHNGHYTATAKVNPNYFMSNMGNKEVDPEGKFYVFNDSSVTQCKSKEAHSHNAYMLFYQKIFHIE